MKPTNNARATRRVFPIGFSLREESGIQFLAFTWRPYAQRPHLTFTEEIILSPRDSVPAGVSEALKAMAQKIATRQ